MTEDADATGRNDLVVTTVPGGPQCIMKPTETVNVFGDGLVCLLQ